MKLKLNPEKTEFIIIVDRQVRESLIQKFPSKLLGNSISPTDTDKNLGITFDSGNTFISHITKVCCACYYNLNEANLQKIQNALCRIVFRLDRTDHCHHFFKNYTDSLLHTASCLNTIYLLSRPSNSPNPYTYHP